MRVKQAVTYCLSAVFLTVAITLMLFKTLFFRVEAIFTKKFWVGSAPEEAPATYRDPKWGKRGSVKVNGVKLFYVEKGEGPLMLCIHGFPENWFSWRHQLAEFSKSYRVVAFDMRGFGESDRPAAKSAYLADALRGDIRGMIEALGERQAVLLSHDWGGAIAWSFAAHHPELLRGLVVMNSPHPLGFIKRMSWRQARKSWYMIAFQLPYVPELLFCMDDMGFLRGSLSQMSTTELSKEEMDVYRWSVLRAGAGGITGGINYYRTLFMAENKASSRTTLKTTIDVPTLVIWGDDDPFLGEELNDVTSQRVKDLQYTRIAKAGHWVQQDRPDEVNSVLRDWLASKVE
eukprot:PLAT6563.1.p1 GENE.PLAT6563.1~~PLAT6563.1.p1  ORF type:complete len:345 (+),score=151.80 PLAT6563.1:187-1221(+)